MSKIAGVYKIINKVNRKYYVGSSNDINCRWNKHKSELNRNIHKNPYLQNAWNKYGVVNFNFVVVEETLQNKSAEQHYLDIAFNERKKCYNTSFVVNHPPKLSEKQNTIKIEKIKSSLKKFYETNKEWHVNQSKKRIQYFQNEENRKKNAELIKKSLSDPLIRQKMSEGRRNKTVYRFQHRKTGEIFIGTSYDFRRKYSIDGGAVHSIVHGKRKSAKDWIFIELSSFPLEHPQ